MKFSVQQKGNKVCISNCKGIVVDQSVVAILLYLINKDISLCKPFRIQDRCEVHDGIYTSIKRWKNSLPTTSVCSPSQQYKLDR